MKDAAQRFLADRWNVAWVVSALALLVVALLVPLDGTVGPWVIAAVALVVIVTSAKLRIGDARRDREQKAERERKAGREPRSRRPR